MGTRDEDPGKQEGPFSAMQNRREGPQRKQETAGLEALAVLAPSGAAVFSAGLVLREVQVP